MKFTCYNAATSGELIGSTITNKAVAVSGGLFTTTLDFGNGVFIGGNVWVEIAVSIASSNSFTTLTPRQQVTVAPYALYALTSGTSLTQANAATGTVIVNSNGVVVTPSTIFTANSNSINSVISSAVVTNNASGVSLNGSFSGSFSGTFTGNGGGLTGLNATNENGSNEFAIRDITAATGSYGDGTPFSDITKDNPPQNNMLGITYNSSVNFLFQASLHGTPVWQQSRRFELTAGLLIGDQATNAYDFGSDPPFIIQANPNLKYRYTNGALGLEHSMDVNNYDPKQCAYINVSAPFSGTGAGLVMSPIQDIQYDGASGYAYGNTLNVTLGNDAIPLAINYGHNVHWTTTVDDGPYGTRDFLGYDNFNGIWHFSADVVGNRCFQDAGYQDAMTINAKTMSVAVHSNLSAATGNFSGNLSATNGFIEQLSTRTANYILSASDSIVLVSAGGVTMTLPPAAQMGSGKTFTIEQIASGTSTIAITGTDTISGSQTYYLNGQYKYVRVVSNGQNYFIIGNN